jgi:alkylation response protein AidB-like acyl-CoA dehydrogenase
VKEDATMSEDVATDERLAAQVRSDVKQWLSAHWSPGQDRRAFAAAAVDAGWARPSWPRDTFGRDLPEELTPIIAEEFTAAGAPVPDTTASAIAATAIKDFAESAELRGPVLRKLLTGEYRTCLLYSEPGAGSDLAAVQTRADRDGEEWVVNGQKVWTSGARQATHGLLAARTNWDVPKRRGITYFLLPMRQDGVEIRPIKQMTGQSSFNEVFFTNARVPDSLRISALEDGWRVLQTALAVERMSMGGGLRRAPAARADRAAGEEAAIPVRGAAELVTIANQTGRNTDPVMRQDIARIHALRRIGTWNAERSGGDADMNIATVLKLAMSTVLHGSARIHTQLLGQESMLVAGGGGSKEGDDANQEAMWSFINSIGGGSDQIQRNLIAERVLGLPHDPSVDHNIPFREARKAEGVRRLS